MKTTFDRTDRSILNVLHMLRPLLQDSEIFGRTITMHELAKFCRNHRRRLPMLRGYKAKEMTEEINDAFRSSSYFQFEDLDIGFFRDEDANGRRRQFIEFQLSVSKEQQHLKALQQKAIEDQI
jgi:hypothetical protein